MMPEHMRTPLAGGRPRLITQRSKVQILPPQPSFSIGYGLRETLRSDTPTYFPPYLFDRSVFGLVGFIPMAICANRIRKS